MEKEFFLEGKLTEKDIEEINAKKPVTVVMKNTAGQNPELLRKLDDDVKIQITGWIETKEISEVNKDIYYFKSLYSPSEIASIIEEFEKIEEQINPKWSNLEKATFVYIYLLRNLNKQYGNVFKLAKSEKEIRGALLSLFDGDNISSDLAAVFKEAMDRLDIPCKHISNSNLHSWNEVSIDGQYYPLDLELDINDNIQFLEYGEFELKHFLSDEKFYKEEIHQTDELSKNDISSVRAMDHSEIQKAIDTVLGYREEDKENNKKELPTIKIRSKELKKFLKNDYISEETNTFEIKELRVELTDENIFELNEDLKEIGQYYPEMLSSVILSNDSGKSIALQDTIDTIYSAQQESLKSRGYLEASKLKIESDFSEDFDLDFSNAPEVIEDPKHPTQDTKNKTTLIFSGKSGTVELPKLKKKLSNNILNIEFNNCNLIQFDISSESIMRNGRDTGKRNVTLSGLGTQGVTDLTGLGDIVSLTVNNINANEFNDVMNISITANNQMPGLFELLVYNQDLQGRHFLREIENNNIVRLHVVNTNLETIDGIDNLKNQLLVLHLNYNKLKPSDIKIISDISKEKPHFLFAAHSNSEVLAQINSLNPMSDDSYQYIDGLLRKTGWYNFREYEYDNELTTEEKKRKLANEMLSQDTDEIPYFIEDAKYFREDLGYTSNPIMIKDVATFQNLLNDPNDYFNQAYMQDATLLLTIDQLEALINSGKRIQQKINIKLNAVSELSEQDLEDLERRCNSNHINLEGVRLIDDRIKTSNNNTSYRNINGSYNTIVPYSIADYKTIREELEKVVSGIDPNLPEVEKFAIVYQRLSKLIPHYDYESTHEPTTKEHAEYNAEVDYSSKNLLGALFRTRGFDERSNSRLLIADYRTVCSSYADVLKQALEMVGIESVYDLGCVYHNVDPINNIDEFTGGHAWNKVKIDGKWYYADLCWDNGENVASSGHYEYALIGERRFCEDKPYQANPTSYNNSHYSSCPDNLRDEQMEQDDYDQQLLRDIFDRTKDHPRIPTYTINIPDDPDYTVPDLDIDRIKDEYISRKDDMYAKYYGDKDYQERYEEISSRYRENEVEVTQNGITYRTIRDYTERADDEKFLILGEYKEALERSSRYEAGDTSVYTGTSAEIQAKYEKDREYVETRNYTFDQNANTQRDLATLGKYGETLPYIQRQQGVAKNILRGIANAGIFARNLVAPIYRFIGRTVAQPLHRLRTRGKDASPYKNNPYHRFVARRDCFNDIAMQNDLNSGSKVHTFRNRIMSNIRAITQYREGNEAVLKAGAFDIQENLKQKETRRISEQFWANKKTELENQIRTLENEIQAHPNATNIQDAQNSLNAKRNSLNQVNNRIASLNNSEKIIDIQTDAVSQTQHDIASKEFNTYKVTVIKGVAKLGAKKFVGPPLKKWLLEHTKKLVSYDVPYQEEVVTRKFIKGTTKKVPITEMEPDYEIGMDGLIERAKGKAVRMFRSVSGGNQGEISYTINGDEVCTGLHFQNGTKWGTGFSNRVPLMTDRNWPTQFVDAAGNLRNDIKFSEIAQAITNGELNQELLNDLTIQVSGKGWVYANELFEGITKTVKAGEKVVEEAGHWEDVVELVDKVRKATKYVDNPRVVNALKVLEHGNNVAMGVDSVHNSAEVLRTTNSNLRSNKKRQRAYNYDDSEFYR